MFARLARRSFGRSVVPVALRDQEQGSGSAVCRYCLEGDGGEEGRLMSRCRCEGSHKWIHDSCHARWLRDYARDKSRCELCGFRFPIGRAGVATFALEQQQQQQQSRQQEQEQEQEEIARRAREGDLHMRQETREMLAEQEQRARERALDNHLRVMGVQVLSEQELDARWQAQQQQRLIDAHEAQRRRESLRNLEASRGMRGTSVSLAPDAVVAISHPALTARTWEDAKSIFLCMDVETSFRPTVEHWGLRHQTWALCEDRRQLEERPNPDTAVQLQLLQRRGTVTELDRNLRREQRRLHQEQQQLEREQNDRREQIDRERERDAESWRQFSRNVVMAMMALLWLSSMRS